MRYKMFKKEFGKKISTCNQLPPFPRENAGHLGHGHQTSNAQGGSVIGWADQGQHQTVIGAQSGFGNSEGAPVMRNPAGRGRARWGGFNQRGRHGKVMNRFRQRQQQFPLNMQAGKGGPLRKWARNQRKGGPRQLNKRKKRPKMRQPTSFESVDLSTFDPSVGVSNGEPLSGPILLPEPTPLHLPSEFVNMGSAVIPSAEPIATQQSNEIRNFGSVDVPLAEPLNSQPARLVPLNLEPIPVAEPPDNQHLQEFGNTGFNDIPLAEPATLPRTANHQNKGNQHDTWIESGKSQRIVDHTSGISHSEAATNLEPPTIFDAPMAGRGNRRNKNKNKKQRKGRRGKKLFKKNKKQNKGKKRKEPKVRQPKEFVPVDLSSTLDHTQKEHVPKAEAEPTAEPPNIESLPGFGLIDWG